MNDDDAYKEDEIVQVHPAHSEFGGCLIVVTGKRDGKLMGYIPIPGGTSIVEAAVSYSDVALVGAKAVWPLAGDEIVGPNEVKPTD